VDRHRDAYRIMAGRRAHGPVGHVLRGEHLSVPPRWASGRTLEPPGRPRLHGATWGARLRRSRPLDGARRDLTKRIIKRCPRQLPTKYRGDRRSPFALVLRLTPSFNPSRFGSRDPNLDRLAPASRA